MIFAISADSVSTSIGAAVAIAAFAVGGIFRPLSRRARENLLRSIETSADLKQLHLDIAELVRTVSMIAETQQNHTERLWKLERLHQVGWNHDDPGR